MPFEEQHLTFMNNPLDPHSQFNQKNIKLSEPNHSQEKSNSTTLPFTCVFTNQHSNSITKNIKKIKPPLDSKPIQFPSCFNGSSNLLSENKEDQAFQQSNQQDQIATKRRTRKNPKRKLCEREEQKRIISVLKEQATNEKPSFIPQSEQKNKITTEQAEIAATVFPKSNLRQKFAHLLPSTQQHTLSSEQNHLITLMSMIDQTVECLVRNRNMNWVFFQDIKRSMRDSLKVFVDFKQLEQLLYLDETLYEIKWEKSKDLKKYDIMVKLSEIKSRQERKAKLRVTIVAFLRTKHEEFLTAKGIKNFVDKGNWHEEFNPHSYEVPRMPLPPHPETKMAQLRCLDDSKINAIKNEKVKELFRSQKQKMQVKSFAKQQSSMEMIFAGTSAQVLQQRLIAAVKERQQQAKLKLQLQAKQIERQKTQVTTETLKQIAQILLKSYAAKNVSNMFKVKVIQMLKEKTSNKFGEFAIVRHLEYLLELTGIGFLKEVMARDGTKILQISIGKYKDVMAHVQELKNRQKEDGANFNV